MQWTTIAVSDADIGVAKAIRKERDARFGNIYPERFTDERWVGDVGEIIFDRWLSERYAAGDCPTHYWGKKNVRGQPDFWIGSSSADLKTVKRQRGPIYGHYGAQVTAQHAHEDVDYFFFATYIVEERMLYLLGGIARDAFLETARYYGSGERVHTYYTVAEGHAIFNAKIADLTSPPEWLTAISCESSVPRPIVSVPASALL